MCVFGVHHVSSCARRKHCIQTERRFDFLRELVEGIPDAAESDETGGPSAGAAASSSTVTAVRAACSEPSRSTAPRCVPRAGPRPAVLALARPEAHRASVTHARLTDMAVSTNATARAICTSLRRYIVNIDVIYCILSDSLFPARVFTVCS